MDKEEENKGGRPIGSHRHSVEEKIVKYRKWLRRELGLKKKDETCLT